MPTTITPSSTSVRRSLVGALSLIAALAITGCGERAAPTAPDAGEAAGGDIGAATTSARRPYISSLQISSNAVFFGADSGSIVFDIVLANPGRRTGGVYLAGRVTQGSLTRVSPAMFVQCSERSGLMPRGTCTMRVFMSVGPGAFVDGKAQFRLRLMQRIDGYDVVHDERTAEVWVVHV